MLVSLILVIVACKPISLEMVAYKPVTDGESWLVLLIFSPFRLVEYLQAMRNFFLMEGGDTMYDFYTSIFDKIREKETWQNVSFLNVQLQEAVGQRYPEDSSR